jgi:hypothetical protein
VIGWIAATIAIAYAVRSSIDVFFTRPSYVFPDPIPFRDVGEAGFVTVGGASVQVRAFFVIAVGVGLAASTRDHSLDAPPRGQGSSGSSRAR